MELLDLNYSSVAVTDNQTSLGGGIIDDNDQERIDYPNSSHLLPSIAKWTGKPPTSSMGLANQTITDSPY